MRLLKKALLIFVVPAAAMFLAGFTLSPVASDAPEVGQAAPDFTLNSQEGTPVSLHDFRGKWVVLYFYPKDFGSTCSTEAHNFQHDLPQYERKNAVVIGISMQSSGSHKRFCAKEGLSFKLLSDADHKVSTMYGSQMNFAVVRFSARHTFLINPEGVIVKEFHDVNVNKHSREVLAQLEELQPGATKP